jgi:hypothetical protein
MLSTSTTTREVIRWKRSDYTVLDDQRLHSLTCSHALQLYYIYMCVCFLYIIVNHINISSAKGSSSFYTKT